MTVNTANTFGLPKITWGSSYQNTIFTDYPIYDWITRSEALEGSQFLRIESGYEDSWIVDTSYVLEATIRFITEDKWDNEWVPFLEWARQKNQFRWFPAYTSLDYVTSYLVEPLTEAPTIEPDGTRTLRLVIRNSTDPYENEQVDVSLLPTNTFPTGNLVFFVDNTFASYPGSGNTWYDLSGNNFDLTYSGSTIEFARTSGFYMNLTRAFFKSSSLFDSFWSSGSAISSSLTIAFAITPDTRSNNQIFSYTNRNASGGEDTKFAIGLNDRIPTGGPNPGSTVRANTVETAYRYITTDPFVETQISMFTDNAYSGSIPDDAETIVLWEISGSTQLVSANISQSLGHNTAYPNNPNTYNIIPANAKWSNESVGQNTYPAVITVGNTFIGLIRAVAVYNRLLTSTEKTQLSDYYKELRTYNPIPGL